MSQSLVACVLGALLACAVVGQVPNLLVNGGFELGPGNHIQAPSTAMNGWFVFVGSIDQVTLWQAPGGTRSLDLDGAEPGGIQQVVPTVPSANYTVTFMMAGNPDGAGQKSMRVSAANQSQVFTFDSTGHTYQSMGWVQRTWSFTANSSSATLEFLSLSTSGSHGPALDEVRLIGPIGGYLLPFGTGCPGTAGTPTLVANQLPYVGQPFSVGLLHLPANSVGLLVLGGGHVGFPSGVLLLGSIGMPGCTLYANLDSLAVIPTTGPFGAYVWGEVLPNEPQIAGALFTLQFFFADPGANPAGMSATEGAIGRVGY